MADHCKHGYHVKLAGRNFRETLFLFLIDEMCPSMLLFPSIPPFLSICLSLSVCVLGGGYVCAHACLFSPMDQFLVSAFKKILLNINSSLLQCILTTVSPLPPLFLALDLCPRLSLCPRSIFPPCLFMKRVVFQESITKKNKARYNKIRQQLPIESGQSIHVGGSISRAGKRVRETPASIFRGHIKTPN